MQTAPASERPSVVELLQRIVANIETIIRTEFRLLKTELQRDAADAGRASILLAAGAGLGQLAAGCLLLSVIYLLGTRLPMWAAALIVAGVTGVIAVSLVMSGVQRLSRVMEDRQKALTSSGDQPAWTTIPSASSR